MVSYHNARKCYSNCYHVTYNMQLLLHTEGEQWSTEKGPWAECEESDFYLLGKQERRREK